MNNHSRIPSSIIAFDTYIASTDEYLSAGTPDTNATRLGIKEDELATWNGFHSEWTPLYALYENKRNSRTMLITSKLHMVIRKTKTYDKEHHILDRIAASPSVTITDLSTFHIKSGPLAKQSYKKLSAPIETLLIPDIKQIGGGILNVKCRNSENSRIAIVDYANGLEYKYLIGGEAPTSATDLQFTSGLSSKAHFSIELGAENIGQTVYLCFRWINSKYPAYSGPWSAIFPVLVI